MKNYFLIIFLLLSTTNNFLTAMEQAQLSATEAPTLSLTGRYAFPPNPHAPYTHVSISQTKNKRGYMEDYYGIHSVDCFPMLGVYDGHGGNRVAEYLKNRLPSVLASCLNTYQIAAALRLALEKVEEETRKEDLEGGSTALVAVLSNSESLASELHIANVGDSRAIIIRDGKIVFRTKDHKPNDPDERKRIEAADCAVLQGRINGSLAMSRTIGDHKEGWKSNEKPAVIANPDIYCQHFTKQDLFIMASDGLWDAYDKDDELLQEINGVPHWDVAQKLVEKASEKSSDNITVLSVFLS